MLTDSKPALVVSLLNMSIPILEKTDKKHSAGLIRGVKERLLPVVIYTPGQLRAVLAKGARANALGHGHCNASGDRILIAS